MNEKSSILIIYNARLVDSHIDSPGTVIIEDGKICGVFLGECKTVKSAMFYASAFLAGSSDDKKPEFYDALGMTLMPSFIDRPYSNARTLRHACAFPLSRTNPKRRP